jgi:hypothetical protein
MSLKVWTVGVGGPKKTQAERVKRLKTRIVMVRFILCSSDLEPVGEIIILSREPIVND